MNAEGSQKLDHIAARFAEVLKEELQPNVHWAFWLLPNPDRVMYCSNLPRAVVLAQLLGFIEGALEDVYKEHPNATTTEALKIYLTAEGFL